MAVACGCRRRRHAPRAMHRLRRRPPRQAALALAPLAYAVALLLVAPGVGSAPSVRRALLQEPAPPSPPPLLASSPPQSPAPPPAPPICAAGTFVNETGCVACEPGSYTPEPGLLECLECPPYYFCPEYSTVRRRTHGETGPQKEQREGESLPAPCAGYVRGARTHSLKSRVLCARSAGALPAAAARRAAWWPDT